VLVLMKTYELQIRPIESVLKMTGLKMKVQRTIASM